MTRIIAEHRRALTPQGSEAPSSQAILLGVGTAVPEMRWSQAQTVEGMAALWNLSGAALDRWRRIVAGSEIETRHGVLAPEIVAPMTTAQRMAELLDAVLLDEERNALGRQRIANIRDELRAYDRAREKLTIKPGR